MRTTKCIIIDDEPIAIRILERHLKVFPDVEVVSTFNKAGEALTFLRYNAVDLLFLDIEMPGMTGIEFIKALRVKPAVIFTTAYRNYAVEAYDMDVVDYLLKPISVERLGRSISRFYERHTVQNLMVRDEPAVLNIKSNKEIVRMGIPTIHYVESFGDYVIIYHDKGRLISRERISQMEQDLISHNFIRIHRRYLVAVSRIVAVQGNMLQVVEQHLPIGRTYRTDLKVLMGI